MLSPNERALDIFSLLSTERLSTMHYGFLVEHCHFEKYMVECLFLADVGWDTWQRQVLSLCHHYPRLAWFLLSLIDQIPTKSDWDRADEDNGVEDNIFLIELLKIAVDSTDQMDSVLAERNLNSIAELLLRERDSGAHAKKAEIEALLLKALQCLLPQIRHTLSHASQDISKAMSGLAEKQQMSDTLKQRITELKTELTEREDFGETTMHSLGWAFGSPKVKDLSDLIALWMPSAQNAQESSVVSSDPSCMVLDVIISECLGWSLAEMCSIYHSSAMPLTPDSFASLTLLLFHILVKKAHKNNLLFHSILALLHAVLSQFRQKEDIQSLLNELGRSPVYAASTAEIASKDNVRKLATQRVICLCNQLMECKSSQDGIIADKELIQQHLMTWMIRVFPFCVLFPALAARHMTLNAILYEAQQRQLIEALDFFAPILERGQNLVITHLCDFLCEMEALPSETLSLFVHSYFAQKSVYDRDCFLDSVCAESFYRFQSPSTTVEGLLKGAVLLLEDSKKQKASIAVHLRLMTSLSPMFQFGCVRGHSSHPLFETIIHLAEQLFLLCSEMLMSAKRSALCSHPICIFMQNCQSLDWNIRVRYVPLVSSFFTEGESIMEWTSIFMPDTPTPLTDLGDEALAEAWMRCLRQMLWFGSLSEEHCSALCTAFRNLNCAGASPLERLCYTFAQEAARLPAEWQSWVLVMALAEVTSTASALCIQRTLFTLLPCYLQHLPSAFPEGHRQDVAVLVVEIFCRVLFVIGSHAAMQENDRNCVLNFGQVQLAHYCMEMLKNKMPPADTELFILRSFAEGASLMSSMNTAPYDITELQMLLSYFLHRLIQSATKCEAGWMLPSGLSLHLVLEWIVSWIQNVRSSVRNALVFTANKLIKDHLEHV